MFVSRWIDCVSLLKAHFNTFVDHFFLMKLITVSHTWGKDQSNQVPFS